MMTEAEALALVRFEDVPGYAIHEEEQAVSSDAWSATYDQIFRHVSGSLIRVCYSRDADGYTEVHSIKEVVPVQRTVTAYVESREDA